MWVNDEADGEPPMTRCLNLIAALLVMASASAGLAQNVDMSTIPPRDTVQLTIYNSDDLTLVRETRHVTFKEGLNQLQFSWANTLIDPSSVDLQFKGHRDELDLFDTTFPHDKPQMLYWNVQSEFDGAAELEISYFTSGISWAADYVCISNPEETTMGFEGFVRIFNNSGEDYEGAEVRLVVGTINLVEHIRQLAQQGIVSHREYEQVRDREVRFSELQDKTRGAVGGQLRRDLDAGAGEPNIIKQGLSEYFIYTIEGTETIKHSWSKRMRLFQGTDAPFRIVYRYRPQEYGHQLVRMFILKNDEESKLGTTPLPDGAVRLFRDNGRDGLSLLVQQQIKYVPIGQEIELNLGVDPEVFHERIVRRNWRDSFWLRDTGRNRHVALDGRERITGNFPVAGWDDHELRVERIRNYLDKPVEVEIRLTLGGHVEFESQLNPKLHDFQSPQFTATIAPGDTGDLAYHVTTHQGIRAKQSNVTLIDGEPRND